MNVSLNWLSQHLDLKGKTPEELDALLTFAGVEVEGIELRGVPTDKIVVAQIKEAVQHPDADKLKVTQVDAGEGALRQIVCGAKNYKVGDKVPCCLPGADLGGFVIGETKMRGVESKGMLAAASEIGLTDEEDGLMILPEDSEVGKPVKELFDHDVLLEVEVTPNRPDLLSHYGMARELATLLEVPLAKLDIPESTSAATAEGIRLEAIDSCPLYTAVRVNGVRVTDSPTWLKQRLEAIGLRPINNIVDITNFVLHELGQPLHAFDAAKVTGDLVIRSAADGETFNALDEASYALESEDCVISDSSGAALALGGVMGGLSSGVTESTTDIILESAYFTPSRIRRTSRRTALSSDSSYRFERGVDPSGVETASNLAIKLILDLAGGSVGESMKAGEAPVLTKPVMLDLARLDQLTGSSIDHDEAGEILQRLGLVANKDGSWCVPSYRADLQRHIDLVEEIVRVKGLDAIPSRLRGTYVPSSSVDKDYDADMRLRDRLAGLGFHECQTIKLISDDQLADALPLKPLRDGDTIRVSLPLSEDHAVLRPSLVPGLIASAERNIRQGAESLRLFELGRFFRNAGGGKATDLEAESLAILISGKVQPGGWDTPERTADLYDLKAIVQALVPNEPVQLVPRDRPGFVLGADVMAAGQNIGSFAMVTPTRQRELDSTSPIYVADLDLAKLRKLSAVTRQIDELPQFPGSSRDAAIEAPAELAAAEIDKAIGKIKEPLLVGFHCFDLFRDPRGEKLSSDRKSIAYRLLYRSPERTLKTKEVDLAHQVILKELKEKLPISFR